MSRRPRKVSCCTRFARLEFANKAQSIEDDVRLRWRRSIWCRQWNRSVGSQTEMTRPRIRVRKMTYMVYPDASTHTGGSVGTRRD
jgi:hypothetical protein